MGTWGSSIDHDDTVADIVDFIGDRLKAGTSLASATNLALAHYAEVAKDDDEAPLLWIALVQA
jgi:hypothetical protein